MAIEPITFEEASGSKATSVGNIEPISPDELFGGGVKVTEEPKVAPVEAEVKKAPQPLPPNIFDIMMKHPMTVEDVQRDPDKFSSEYSGTDLITKANPNYDIDKAWKETNETLQDFASLTANPPKFIKGVGELIFSIPGLIVGIPVAAQRAAETAFNQIVLGGTLNMEDIYFAAAKGLQGTMELMHPGVEAVWGKTDRESQLVGAVAMAPLTGLSTLGNEIAEWKGFKDWPNIRGIVRFAGDLVGAFALHFLYKGTSVPIASKVTEAAKKAEKIKTTEEVLEFVPEDAAKRAKEKVLEVEKRQLELEIEELKKKINLDSEIKKEAKKKAKEIEEAKKVVEVEEEQIRNERLDAAKGKIEEEVESAEAKEAEPVTEPKVESPSPKRYKIKKIEPVEPPKKVLKKRAPKDAKEEEIITDLDRQTGVDTPLLEGERNPFFQNEKVTKKFAELFDEKGDTITNNVEVYTQKLINDVNRWYHGEEIDINGVRNLLSELAAKAEDVGSYSKVPMEFNHWNITVKEAAIWARNVRRPELSPIIEQRGGGTKLYSGLPLDEVGKEIFKAGRSFKNYVDNARGIKKFRPIAATKKLNKEFKRAFVDRSGNIRLDLLDTLGDAGYKVIQKMYLSKGAYAHSAALLEQMRKEIYGGLSRSEKAILDNLILAERMVAISNYKAPSKYNYPKGASPTESTAYIELFQHIEGLHPERAKMIRGRVEGYFEWMKRPLKDMLDAELISEKEYELLSSHNYRRTKLVDIFDRRYQAKIGKRMRNVYDSGIEALARGRDTDIYEPSSEIMALEVFNRTYGRILNNAANKSLAEVAKNDPKNPFVRVKTKGSPVPTGWQRMFYYEGGKRKSMYLSPEMSKEWIVNSPEISYRLGQFLRYTSMSPVLRTFATGINWGFALANLPRDVMHAWYAARVFENGEWKSLYSPHFPIFVGEMSRDISNVFMDVVTRGPKYQEYIKRGGGMEFLVHQGRILSRGRRLEGPFDKIQNVLGYFGETSELLTRLALEERVAKRRAKEKGTSVEEIRKDKDIMDEATFAARDYMDFGQGGGITKAADNALPYLSATVQATRGLWRVAAENPRTFAYKVAQIGAMVTLLYSAMRKDAPLTTEELQGSIDMQNNLCIPLGDDSSFVDADGQTRYIFFKVPLDPSQKFFKAFFEGATDKMLGKEVDVDRITNNLMEQSPVGITNLPPSLSGGIGYLYNKDLWKNEDIWKESKPFDYPRSKEEYVPGKTPQAYVDVGQTTGLSPERFGHAVEEVTTGGTLWSYLVGKGYESLRDVPKDEREQHLAMVLSRTPVIKRFIGITSPYTKYKSGIKESEQSVDLDYWIQNRELDRRVNGFFMGSNDRKEIWKYIGEFKEENIRKRLIERFDFHMAMKDVPERAFWLKLQAMKTPAKARVYYERWMNVKDDPSRLKQLNKESARVDAAGGVFSDSFWDEFSKLRMRSRTKTGTDIDEGKVYEPSRDTDIDIDDVISSLKRNEGLRLKAYKDSRGNLTIGYGHKVLSGDPKVVDKDKAEELLQNDLEIAMRSVNNLPEDILNNLNKDRKEVLVRMTYNMGGRNLREFKKMLDAIRRNDFEAAANEISSGIYSKQVGNRAKELAKKMREGK
jgi:lysozyme